MYLPCALYFKRLVVEAAGVELSAFSARGCMATSYVLPAAGNSGRNGRGLIVGCLQQYRFRD